FRTIEFPGSTDERVADMAMDSVGRPVLLLNTSLGAGLVRLTAAGTLDTSFDGDGRALVPDVTEGSGLALLGDGPVVVGRNGSVNGDLVVARYTSTGLPDTGFGTSGSFTVAMEGTGSGGVDVAVAGTSIFTLSLDDDGTDA